MRITGKVILIIVLTVTTIISVIFYVLAYRFDRNLEYSLLSTARSLYKHVLIVRKWVSDYEGIYIKKPHGALSNPFLPHPELVTTEGDTLTLKNPALVTRELSELSMLMGGNFSFHMASRNYINPVNQPDPFELKALIYFEDSLNVKKTQEFYRKESLNGEPYFRYFAPIYIQESCITCHGPQGYKIGDLRGGISILLTMKPYQEAKRDNWIFFLSSAVVTIIFLSIIIFVAIRRSVIIPLRLIENSAQKIKNGNYDFEIKLPQKDEIGSLAIAFEEMRKKIKFSTSQLKQSEKKYRSLIEHSLEAVAIINANGGIIESNDKFTHLTAYNSKELKRLSFYDLIDTQHQQMIKKSGRSKTDAEHYETILRSRDSLEIPVEIYQIKGFSIGTESDLSFVYVRDLSERKKIEQYSIQTEKMFALGQISSGIAHEIRNPLFALSNNIDYLNKKYGNQTDFQEVYPELQNGIDRIHKLVSAILDYARPHEPEFKCIKVSSVIDKSLILVQKQLEKSAIQIDTDYQNADVEIEADPHHLEQVFINLFLNAFQAMEDTGTLIIRSIPKTHHLEIQISDTGKGIPPEEISRIFDPFYTKSPNGTGLGLAIVQRFLDQHNARYRIKSDPGRGTTFYIFMPYKQG